MYRLFKPIINKSIAYLQTAEGVHSYFLMCNKCSAVAEMGNRLATVDMGQKEGAAVPLSGGSWVSI